MNLSNTDKSIFGESDQTSASQNAVHNLNLEEVVDESFVDLDEELRQDMEKEKQESLLNGGSSTPTMQPTISERLSDDSVAKSIKPEKDHFWRTIVIFIFIVATFRLFIIDPFLVHGNSMQPTFEDGNYVIVDKLTYKITDPSRGDVIVFDAPTDDGRYFIKRVIGLPGERVVVNGSKVTIFNTDNPTGFSLSESYIKFESNRTADKTLASDEYFVMGDNREVSSDSRIWGALNKDAITGRALVRLLPFSDISLFPGSISKFDGVSFPSKK